MAEQRNTGSLLGGSAAKAAKALSGTDEPPTDETSGLQKLAGLGGAAATGYGVYQNIFGEDPLKGVQASVDARNRAALQGRLGASQEELQQQRDGYGQQAASIAGIGGEAAQQAALAQGMGGVPGGQLSGKAVQAQAQYIEKAGDIAAKGSQQVGQDNLKRILVEESQLRDDEKYLGQLRSQTESTTNQLALMGGKALLGIATGGASEAVPLGTGIVNKALS